MISLENIPWKESSGVQFQFLKDHLVSVSSSLYNFGGRFGTTISFYLISENKNIEEINTEDIGKKKFQMEHVGM